MKKEDLLNYHYLQAMWWIHSASNGHCESRKLYHGINGPEFNKDEKRDEAMEVAQRHIQNFAELAEQENEPKLV